MSFSILYLSLFFIKPFLKSFLKLFFIHQINKLQKRNINIYVTYKTLSPWHKKCNLIKKTFF